MQIMIKNNYFEARLFSSYHHILMVKVNINICTWINSHGKRVYLHSDCVTCDMLTAIRNIPTTVFYFSTRNRKWDALSYPTITCRYFPRHEFHWPLALLSVFSIFKWLFACPKVTSVHHFNVDLFHNIQFNKSN